MKTQIQNDWSDNTNVLFKGSFKFAHLADSHIGGWRDPKMKLVGLEAFKLTIEECRIRNVDFVLISGDLFNTSIPGIDLLKEVTLSLKSLKDAGIRTYIIPGSHDFSTSGKTMIDVLESAGLFTNVVRGKMVDNKLLLQPIIDKTGVEITGMLGRRLNLENSIYENLDRSIENPTNLNINSLTNSSINSLNKNKNLSDSSLSNTHKFRIFMFHSAIEEYKPKHLKDMGALSLSLLPKGFDYYAGGHVHVNFVKDEENYGKIVFPGPTYPNSFSELEMIDRCGFYIYDSSMGLKFISVDVAPHISFKLDCSHMVPEKINSELLLLLDRFESELKNAKTDIKADIKNTNAETNTVGKNTVEQNKFGPIVTLRLYGTIDGKVSDIDFRTVFDKLYGLGAYFVMKKTSKLMSKEYDKLTIKEETVEEIEKKIIDEGVGKIKTPFEESEDSVAFKLIEIYSETRADGENKSDYAARIKENANKVFKDILHPI